MNTAIIDIDSWLKDLDKNKFLDTASTKLGLVNWKCMSGSALCRCPVLSILGDAEGSLQEQSLEQRQQYTSKRVCLTSIGVKTMAL